MKYYFKEYIKLPVLNFWSILEDNKISLSIFSLGDLYKLSFTNQRAYFNTTKMLSDNGELDKIDIFSIESTKEELDFSVSWFQRRTQNKRLRDIAKYLITKWEDIEYYWTSEDSIKHYLSNLWYKAIFPNNIIVSLNNELQYWKEHFIHDLYLSDVFKCNLDDLRDLKSRLENVKALNLDTWKIIIENLDGNLEAGIYSQLCFIYNNLLHIPTFELDPNINDDDIVLFANNSPLYNKTFKSMDISDIKSLERFYKIAWIIDGQHRTMSLRFLDEEIFKLKNQIIKYLKKIKKIDLIEFFDEEAIKLKIKNKSIAVTSYLNSTLWEQADIFLDINNNAKQVDKSLTYDLLPLTAQWITVELAAKSVFDKFNQTQESPLYKVLFNIRWFEKQGGRNILSQANFINELKYYLKGTKAQDRIFYKYFEKKKLTPVYWAMYSFFNIINDRYKDLIFTDGIYNDKEYAIYRTTWFWALLQFMVLILKDINIDGFDEDSYQDDSNEINKIFREKIQLIYEKIKFTRWELSNFRWKWGQKDLAMIMKIYSWLDSIKNYEWELKDKIEWQMRIFEW